MNDQNISGIPWNLPVLYISDLVQDDQTVLFIVFDQRVMHC